VLAANQQETLEVEGNKLQLTGTVLLFDLKDYEVYDWKPMTRLQPILEWNEQRDATMLALGKPVYLGNIVTAGLVTLVCVAALLIVILLIANRAKKGMLRLLCGPDGALSLWRSQVAAWTVATGAMVLLFGLIRIEVPNIPATLVVLMGMTVVTGGLSHFQGKRNAQSSTAGQPAPAPLPSIPQPASPPANAPAAVAVEVAPPPAALAAAIVPSVVTPPVAAGAQAPVLLPVRSPKLADLISTEGADGTMQVSITRAQLLFWTCLSLGLFVTKTLLEGVLWNVPDMLVALMGISQASYLTPKFLDK
jgi:hypothetical protein